MLAKRLTSPTQPSQAGTERRGTDIGAGFRASIILDTLVAASSYKMKRRGGWGVTSGTVKFTLRCFTYCTLGAYQAINPAVMLF